MVKITVLSENNALPGFRCEHGLSLYIEACGRKLLFDTGGSSLFAENARMMGIDLTSVEMVILSHGHYDHGGGLSAFLDINNVAPVYVRPEAFGKHYAGIPLIKKYIGLDKTLEKSNRFVFTVNAKEMLNSELMLFSNVQGNRFSPPSNKRLYKKNETGSRIIGSFSHDDFSHEQNLVIYDGNNTILVSGCSHRGIVNIIDSFRTLTGRTPTHVIGGLHLMQSHDSFVTQIASYLQKTAIRFHIGHCTGSKPYSILKKLMGDRIQPIPAGATITI